jgi:hypothetical protein
VTRREDNFGFFNRVQRPGNSRRAIECGMHVSWSDPNWFRRTRLIYSQFMIVSVPLWSYEDVAKVAEWYSLLALTLKARDAML